MFLPVVGQAELVVADAVSVVVKELAVFGGPPDLHDPAGHDQHLVVPAAWTNKEANRSLDD